MSISTGHLPELHQQIAAEMILVNLLTVHTPARALVASTSVRYKMRIRGTTAVLAA
jgi:hypothetical protein